MSHSARQTAVLFVDDETKAQRYFLEAFQDDFPVYTASNSAEACALLNTHGPEIGVVVTDQRMPGEQGVDLLERVRRYNPNIVRILVTAFTDYQAAVDAVNDGRVFRYIHKPWEPEELAATLAQAREHYARLVEREHLLRLKAETVRQMHMSDKVSGMAILAEGLNHHLRNALTAVRAFIDLAPHKLADELGGRAPADADFWGEYQKHAQSQLDRIYTILGNVAEASPPRQLGLDEKVAVSSLIASVFSSFDSAFIERGIAVFLDIDPATPPLRVNGEKFRRLWHLIFTEELASLATGDELVIAVVPADDSRGRRCVRITVSDNGQWPAQERHMSIFEPFFTRTRQPDDLGVRMMACYNIVHSHGGVIEAHASQQGGLEVRMDFPLDAVAPPEMGDFFACLMEHERRWSEREQETAG